MAGTVTEKATNHTPLAFLFKKDLSPYCRKGGNTLTITPGCAIQRGQPHHAIVNAEKYKHLFLSFVKDSSNSREKTILAKTIQNSRAFFLFVIPVKREPCPHFSVNQMQQITMLFLSTKCNRSPCFFCQQT
jgi:hypothetical protein